MRRKKGPVPSREELLGRDVIERDERLTRALRARLDRYARELEERRRARQQS
jgi:hypothetical protein